MSVIKPFAKNKSKTKTDERKVCIWLHAKETVVVSPKTDVRSLKKLISLSSITKIGSLVDL